jgi:hypothetical protein
MNKAQKRSNAVERSPITNEPNTPTTEEVLSVASEILDRYREDFEELAK